MAWGIWGVCASQRQRGDNWGCPHGSQSLRQECGVHGQVGRAGGSAGSGAVSRNATGRNQLWLRPGWDSHVRVGFTRQGGMRLGESWGAGWRGRGCAGAAGLRHGSFTTGSCCTGTAPAGRAGWHCGDTAVTLPLAPAPWICDTPWGALSARQSCHHGRAGLCPCCSCRSPTWQLRLSLGMLECRDCAAKASSARSVELALPGMGLVEARGRITS